MDKIAAQLNATPGEATRPELTRVQRVPLVGTQSPPTSCVRVRAAQVLLAWSLAQGYVPITTSSKPERLKEFLQAATADTRVTLTQEQVSMSDGAAHWLRGAGGALTQDCSTSLGPPDRTPPRCSQVDAISAAGQQAPYRQFWVNEFGDIPQPLAAAPA